MSDTDSFIEEVSEEVRRDKLFGYIRKYGWIAAAAVIILVGGATFNEWRKAQARAEAEARGDALLAALSVDEAEARAAALGDITPQGDSAAELGAVVQQLRAAELRAAEDPAGAAEALEPIAANGGLDPVYRDMAVLKLAILTADDTDPATQIERLTPLTAPGAPYRTLAEEQIALAEIASGDTAAALDRIRALAEDAEASPDLRRRVSRLIVALGGDTDPA